MGFLSLLPGCSLDDSGLDSPGVIVTDSGEVIGVELADVMPETTNDDAGTDAADAAGAADAADAADAEEDLPADEQSTVDLSAEMATSDVPPDAGAPDTMAIGRCGEGSAPLLTTAWTATASAQSRNETPDKAFDGQLSTRWSTGADAAIGDWFRLDLHDAHTISRIQLDAGAFAGDFPRGYAVSLSADDIMYHQVSSGTGTDQQTTVSFPAESSRYVKITLTAPSPGKWWSIAELIVCGY